MTNQTRSIAAAITSPAREQLRIARVLLGGYAALSVLTLVAIVVVRGDPDLVTGAVWIRGSILAVASLISYALGVSMAQGSRRHYRRVQIVALAQVTAIVVIACVPGAFPVWFRIENGLCGALLVVVLLVTVARPVRSAFASR